MKKTKDPGLISAITDFMKVYAPVVRRRSSNTVKSYGCAINNYFDFLKETKGKTMFTASTADFTRDDILAFMDWLQTSRGNEVSTVNQRLAHIRTFCNYMMKNNLLALTELGKINDISKLDDLRKREFIYLSVEDVKFILQMPNPHTKAGIRDRFFMALLYDSGCRDQEILNLKIKDFVFENPSMAELHVIGKGNKYRVTPISAEVAEIFHQYCNLCGIDVHADSNAYIFTTKNTRRGGAPSKMSDDNTQRILRKYEAKAKETRPNFPHLHAHLFRRTRAMHLYTAGVDLTLIADWLGHSNLETVQVYARATVDMKRKATSKLSEDEHSVFQNDVSFKYSDDEDALKRLCGLK